MKKITVITFIGFLALTGICLAEGPPVKREGVPAGKWWRMPGVNKDLNLNDEEQEKLDDLYIENRRRMIDLKSTVDRERLELEQLLDQKDFNESACMDRFKRLQNASTNLSIERFRFLIEIRKLLGYDRYEKLKIKFQEHRMRKRIGRKPGRQGTMKGYREGKGPQKGEKLKPGS